MTDLVSSLRLVKPLEVAPSPSPLGIFGFSRLSEKSMLNPFESNRYMEKSDSKGVVWRIEVPWLEAGGWILQRATTTAPTKGAVVGLIHFENRSIGDLLSVMLHEEIESGFQNGKANGDDE